MESSGLKQSLGSGLEESIEPPSANDVASSEYLKAEHVKKLGRGTFGDVFLVRLPIEGGSRTAVCKRCPFDDELSDEQKYELYHEVRILSSLSHPNIVQYLDSARQQGELCIWMEYCEGGTLALAIKRRAGTPFETAVVVRWLHQLASALTYVHAECILHRDLKTANVFLTASGDIKLGDFGLSRTLSTYTHFATSVVGTPYYMAPEVLASESYAHAADCWSLGVILFELLTLRRPFDGTSFGSIMSRISRCEYDVSFLETSGHPEELQRMAGREALLNPDPEERMRLDAVLRYTILQTEPV